MLLLQALELAAAEIADARAGLSLDVGLSRLNCLSKVSSASAHLLGYCYYTPAFLWEHGCMETGFQ